MRSKFLFVLLGALLLIPLGKGYAQMDSLAGSISGVVTDTAFAPIPGAMVVVFSSARPDMPAGMGKTDSAGHYRIFHLLEGDYLVIAGAMGYEPRWYNNVEKKEDATPVHVTRGQDTPDINFALPKMEFPNLGGIAGRVVDKVTANPIMGACVIAFNAEFTHLYYHTRTDSLGHYLLKGLVPGEYVVIAKAFNYLPEKYPELVNVPPDTIVRGINFALMPKLTGGIAGVVLDAHTGEPVPKTFVFAHKLDGSCAGFAISDSTGFYRIKELDPGFYRLIAYALEYFPEKYPDSVLVKSGEVTPDINFHLKKYPPLPDGMIAGNVTDDSTGLPIPKALVMAIGFPDTNLPPSVRTTLTNEDGTYKLTHLPRIPFILFAHAHGYLGEFYDNAYSFKDATPVTPDAYEINFALKARETAGLSSLGGRVTLNQMPAEGAFVFAYSGNQLKGIFPTLFDGSYSIEDLSPGIYSLNVTYPGIEAIASASADLTQLESPILNFNLSSSSIYPYGDANRDRTVSISDVIFLANYLLKGGEPLQIPNLADANGDCSISLSDVIHLCNYLLKGGSAPQRGCLN